MLVATFRVSDARYAIPCQRIIEVIPLVVLRPVARAPAWIRGSLVFRGALTSVVDLCQLIGGYDCPVRLSSRIILTNCALPGAEEIKVGLLAEHLIEARHLNGKSLAGVALSTPPYLGEVMQEDDGPLQMLHAERILLGSGSALAGFFCHGRLATGEADRAAPES
jgi:chemotaxis-related protein WspB